LQQHPDRVLREAVWGMLPKNRMGRALLKRLKIYAGPNHPHGTNHPVPLA
jgi:large subunit ribosomal protein L13